MKKFWKALGLTALAATLIPYYVDEDKETGSVTVKALFWKFTKKTDADGQKDITLKFLSFGPDEEDSLFTDNPEEAVLFADDDPDAAAIAAEEAAIAEHEAAIAAEEEATAQEEAGEADFDPEL